MPDAPLAIAVDLREPSVWRTAWGGIFGRATKRKYVATGMLLDQFLHENLDHMRDALALATPEGAPHTDDTPHMRDRWRAEMIGPHSGMVSNDAPYANFLRTGTAAHIILPRNTLMLRFTGADGSAVFAHLVHHPGTQPDLRLVEAIAVETERIRRLFATLGAKATETAL